MEVMNGEKLAKKSNETGLIVERFKDKFNHHFSSGDMESIFGRNLERVNVGKVLKEYKITR